MTERPTARQEWLAAASFNHHCDVDCYERFGVDIMTPHHRTRLVNFRVTPEEMEHLAAKANAAGLSVSTYVRTQLVMGREQMALEDRLVAALEAAAERISARRRVA